MFTVLTDYPLLLANKFSFQLLSANSVNGLNITFS